MVDRLFYQDVTRYKNSVHMYIEDLVRIIPENKGKNNCMHFDDDKRKNCFKKQF